MKDWRQSLTGALASALIGAGVAALTLYPRLSVIETRLARVEAVLAQITRVEVVVPSVASAPDSLPLSLSRSK